MKKNMNNAPSKVSNKPKSTTARKATVKQPNSIKSAVVISDCARDYARALTNPFTGPLACVPISPTVLSRKLRVFSKGEFRTGTSGVGFIVADPSSAIANDITTVNYSLANYAGTIIGGFFDVGVVLTRTNSDYINTAFGTGASKAQYRVVSAGLRVRYIGTNLNMGGTIIAFVDPTSSSIVGRSASDLRAEMTSRRLPVNREWSTILWRPVLINDYSFTTNAPSTAAGSGVWGPMGFLIESPDSTISMLYEYEFSVVLEVNGRDIRGQTVTKSDVVGQTAIASVSLTANSFIPHQMNATISSENFLDRVANEIHTANSYVASGGKVLAELATGGKLIYDAGKLASALL
jgi:predicted enzyme related to lactoylglutathione lyase